MSAGRERESGTTFQTSSLPGKAHLSTSSQRNARLWEWNERGVEASVTASYLLRSLLLVLRPPEDTDYRDWRDWWLGGGCRDKRGNVLDKMEPVSSFLEFPISLSLTFPA